MPRPAERLEDFFIRPQYPLPDRSAGAEIHASRCCRRSTGSARRSRTCARPGPPEPTYRPFLDFGPRMTALLNQLSHRGDSATISTGYAPPMTGSKRPYLKRPRPFNRSLRPTTTVYALPPIGWTVDQPGARYHQSPGRSTEQQGDCAKAVYLPGNRQTTHQQYLPETRTHNRQEAVAKAKAIRAHLTPLTPLHPFYTLTYTLFVPSGTFPNAFPISILVMNGNERKDDYGTIHRPGKGLNLTTPATYRIRVQGRLDSNWADRLGGMSRHA